MWQEDKFEFYVPAEPKTWKSGPVVNGELEIGATGLLDGNTVSSCLTEPCVGKTLR